MKKSKLKDVSTLFAGYPFDGHLYCSEGVRVVRGDNVTIGSLRWDADKRWNLPFKEKDEYSLKDEDIVIGMDGSRVGRNRAMVLESDLPLFLAQRVACVRNNERSNQKFLYYSIFNSRFEQYINTIHTGTSIPHISLEQLGDYSFPLPELNVQKRIGEFLFLLDKKITLNMRMNAELEAMAKQLYDYWFVQFDFPDENGNPYKSSGGKMVYNSTLKREIPAGWDSCKLGDFCNLYQPKTIGIDEMNINGKYHVYGANGLIGFYDKYNHEESEIVMACRGNSCGVINRTMPFSWITGNAMVLSVKDKSISNEFISQCTNYMNIKGAITGSGQPQLTRENLAPLLMILPSKDILTLFTRKIDFIVREQLHIKTEIEYLTHLRDSLLPMLMNGQVTVE